MERRLMLSIRSTTRFNGGKYYEKIYEKGNQKII
jgi:hypothetical protein